MTTTIRLEAVTLKEEIGAATGVATGEVTAAMTEAAVATEEEGMAVSIEAMTETVTLIGKGTVNSTTNRTPPRARK